MLTLTRRAVAPMPTLPRAGRRAARRGRHRASSWPMGCSSSRCGSATAGSTSWARWRGSRPAIGQVTALLGTYLALIQLLLMSRAPWLDRTFGRIGSPSAIAGSASRASGCIVGHGVFTTARLRALRWPVDPGREFWTLITTWDFVLMATRELALFIAVAVTSVRLARRSFPTRPGTASTSTPTSRSPSASPISSSSAPISSTTRSRGVLDRAVRRHLRTARSPFRFGAPIVVNCRASIPGRERGRGSAGRRLGLPVRPRARAVHDPRRPVRRGPVPDRGWWRAHPYSISAATEWALAPVHGQGARRRLRRARPPARSARAPSSRARTAT